MSTRSLINVECNDGKIRSIYCHFDGMSHFETLKKYYNSQEDAENLISLGDLSSLGKRLSPKMGENHSFDNPIEGICVAYGRDRGEDEEEVKANEFNSFEEAKHQNRGQEYIYEWKKPDKKWFKIKI